jgi:hypothetical protein
VAEPQLFYRRHVPTRDRKLIGAAFIFLGGFVGRALVDQVGPAGSLGVGTGLRVLVAVGWAFAPSKPQKQEERPPFAGDWFLILLASLFSALMAPIKQFSTKMLNELFCILQQKMESTNVRYWRDVHGT